MSSDALNNFSSYMAAMIVLSYHIDELPFENNCIHTKRYKICIISFTLWHQLSVTLLETHSYIFLQFIFVRINKGHFKFQSEYFLVHITIRF